MDLQKSFLPWDLSTFNHQLGKEVIFSNHHWPTQNLSLKCAKEGISLQPFDIVMACVPREKVQQGHLAIVLSFQKMVECQVLGPVATIVILRGSINIASEHRPSQKDIFHPIHFQVLCSFQGGHTLLGSTKIA